MKESLFFVYDNLHKYSYVLKNAIERLRHN